ncbi:MAG TPA: lipopolysaccharide biosynthesis protein [Kofleriaceae bacterium]|nr:lipopolysaccharide biosynthesis protein [Kofleriaceae bacterium]
MSIPSTLLPRLRQLVRAALGQSSPLILARLLSAALTFGLPLVLVRLLEPQAFGTYKQFFLVSMTVLMIGQLGLTQSLFYFLPRGGAERGAYVTHTLGSLTILGLVFGGGLAILAPWVAAWVGSPELAHVALPLGLYTAAMLGAAPLEGALTSEGRLGGAATSYVITDAVRAGALVLAAKFFGGTGIYWAAALVALLRVGALWLLVARRILPIERPHAGLWRKQLAYALPFAGASLLYVGQRYFSQYAVSASFDPATFALFAVAAFHLPVVDIVYTPVSEVLMVQLGKHDASQALKHWDDGVRKLAAILFPATCGAFILGPTILPLLFTHKYAGSVPLFLLTTLEIPLWILPVDALLRASNDTRFLFAFNGVRILITGAAVLTGIRVAGLPGAILGGIASEAVARVVMLARGRRFLAPHARVSQLLDWNALGRIAVASLLAGVPAWAMRLALPPGMGMVVAAIGVYGVAYVALYRTLVNRARAELVFSPG